MDLNKTKDDILLLLEGKGNRHLKGEITIQKALEINPDTRRILFNELSQEGFIEAMTTCNGDDIGDKYRITDKGSVFINRTSFVKNEKESQDQADTEKKRHNRTAAISISSVVIAAVGVAVSVIMSIGATELRSAVPKQMKENIDSISSEIDDLKRINTKLVESINEIKNQNNISK